MNKIYQVSTLNALMLGNLYGVISIKELLANGDCGIGTCEGVDGEMIILDGVAYNGQATGTVRKYKDDEEVAFAAVSSFSESSRSYILEDVESLKDLGKRMTRLISDKYKNKNVFYIVKVKAKMNSIKVKSCHKENEPYRTLMEINLNQVKHEYNDIEGAIVGIFCPEYVENLNMPGWHFHFISEDKTKGGHVLNLSFAKGEVLIDQKTQYEISLPTNDEFATINLSADLKDDINKVEH